MRCRRSRFTIAVHDAVKLEFTLQRVSRPSKLKLELQPENVAEKTGAERSSKLRSTLI
jgi:hypothetical protein